MQVLKELDVPTEVFLGHVEGRIVSDFAEEVIGKLTGEGRVRSQVVGKNICVALFGLNGH